MNTFRFALLSLAVVLLFNGCKKEDPQPLTSLVTNGNVEQQLQGWAFNYAKSNQANPNGYDFGFTDETAASPRYSLKINCNQVKNDSSFFSYYQQKLSTKDISVGAKLTLKAKIKTVNLTGNGVSLVLRGDQGSKTVFFVSTEGKTTITGTKEFTEYNVTVDSFPGNVDNLVLFLVYLPKTTGSVYFDDVSLTTN